MKKIDSIKLPDAPDFISMPPKLPLWALNKLAEEMLATWNQKRFVTVSEDSYLPFVLNKNDQEASRHSR